MVTTFVRPIRNLTIEEASRADIRLAEMEHTSLGKKVVLFGQIYVHPCFYRSLKMKYPLYVGGIS